MGLHRAWADRAAPSTAGLSDGQRAALAAAWTRDALIEHASVASFARLAMELMAHGAPPALLLEANLAAADEIEHARAAFSIASALGGAPVGPGALRVPARPTPELAQLAVEAFREGCVGETLATLLAAEQLARATDPTIRAALERVVADEARHAALAWAVARWALGAGGEPVREALRAELATLRAPTVEPTELECPSHGLLSAEHRARAVADGLRRVVRPAAEALLA